MNFSYEQVRRLYLGRWCDFFEEYKKAYNMTVKQALFAEPRKVESMRNL